MSCIQSDILCINYSSKYVSAIYEIKTNCIVSLMIYVDANFRIFLLYSLEEIYRAMEINRKYTKYYSKP